MPIFVVTAMTVENPAPQKDLPASGLASSGVGISTGTNLITLAYYVYSRYQYPKQQ